MGKSFKREYHVYLNLLLGLISSLGNSEKLNFSLCKEVVLSSIFFLIFLFRTYLCFNLSSVLFSYEDTNNTLIYLFIASKTHKKGSGIHQKNILTSYCLDSFWVFMYTFFFTANSQNS